MELKDIVIAAASAYKAHWRRPRSRSEDAKLAAKVTSEWQNTVRATDPSRFTTDGPVAPHLREHLSLFDVRDGAAYEFRPSPNSLDLAFYQDIFKAWVAKQHSYPSLRRLVFIACEPAAKRLHHGLAKDVLGAGTALGFGVELVIFRPRTRAR